MNIGRIEKKRWTLISFFPALLVLTMWDSVSAESVCTAEPAQLVFNNLNDSKEFVLRCDGTEVSPQIVKDWRLYAGESSYSHMIRVSRTSNRILVSPNKTAEVGTYVLVLNTTRGAIQLDVVMSLADHKSVIEKNAEAWGVSEVEAKKKMGLAQTIERNGIHLNLAATYYVGNTLEIEVPPVNSRVCVWKVNGTVVLEGQGKNKLIYTFTTPGDTEITYEEWVGGSLVVTATSKTKVKEQPPTHFETTVNTKVVFKGPEGYGNYSWYVGDELCCHSQNKEYVFEAPGKYIITCVACKPLRTGLRETQKISYAVVVR